MCREHKRLPPSYTITDELSRFGEYPYGGGGNADVWRGVYRGSKVAIKTLRVNSRVDLAGLERVRPFISIIFTEDPASADESWIEILFRSSPVEAIQTPESVAVDGGEKSTTNPDDDLRMDGTRYHHGLRNCVPWGKPAKTSKNFAQGFE